ncbi:hypothetical protein DEO72_LG8g1902 [Vigna unguiculata]|uniref:Uncharacterized protein n=1 Tax=Vigna unguiculata TaxID=3917 RepID=A0A4D6MR17_VIGUN|nr:hypothetical protein DEO72_LG8g1902 [Vigna unguiculata]
MLRITRNMLLSVPRMFKTMSLWRGEIVGDANGNVNEVKECKFFDRAEFSRDENGVIVNVVEVDNDVNQGDHDFECVEFHNDVAVVDGVEEEVTVVADANSGNDV